MQSCDEAPQAIWSLIVKAERSVPALAPTELEKVLRRFDQLNLSERVGQRPNQAPWMLSIGFGDVVERDSNLISDTLEDLLTADFASEPILSIVLCLYIDAKETGHWRSVSPQVVVALAKLGGSFSVDAYGSFVTGKII